MLLGVHLTLMIGPTVPVPAPARLTELLQGVEVTLKDRGRGGFQMTFEAGRSGPFDLRDYPLLSNPLLRPFNRVVLVVMFNVTPKVLIDGIITNQQLSPGATPGTSTFAVTGEDVSVMMDLEKKVREHPAQDETAIASRIILGYPQYQIVPRVTAPPVIDPPVPTNRTPVQHKTDLEYLNAMAERHGYVFYVEAGPAPLTNIGYWGPAPRLGVPQKALSVNMGPDTNVESIKFQYNALAPTLVSGEVPIRNTDITLPLFTLLGSRPPLVSQPALPFNLPNVRRTTLEDTRDLDYARAYARAQAITDKSVEEVVTAEGELDALRYGALLKPRGLVGLRGAGYSYDGFYYVKQVTHKIRPGEYKQGFTLTREGTGAISPVVIP